MLFHTSLNEKRNNTFFEICISLYLTIPIPKPNHNNVIGIPILSKTVSNVSESVLLYKLSTNDEILIN